MIKDAHNLFLLMDFHPGASSPNIFNWIPTKWLNKVKTSGPWLGVVSGQDREGQNMFFDHYKPGTAEWTAFLTPGSRSSESWHAYLSYLSTMQCTPPPPPGQAAHWHTWTHTLYSSLCNQPLNVRHLICAAGTFPRISHWMKFWVKTTNKASRLDQHRSRHFVEMIYDWRRWIWWWLLCGGSVHSQLRCCCVQIDRAF